MAYIRKNLIGQWSIHNRGTIHAFYPLRKVIDPWTNKETTLLAVHVQKVRDEHSRQVYIVDEDGRLFDEKKFELK
jgi:hypothetical protein